MTEKIPSIENKTFNLRIRKLAREIRVEKITTSTKVNCDRKISTCELNASFSIAHNSYEKIDLLTIPGHYLDRIEAEGLETCLTSEDSMLRAIATVIHAFNEIPQKAKSLKMYKSRSNFVLSSKEEDEEDISFDEEDIDEEDEEDIDEEDEEDISFDEEDINFDESED